MPRTRARFTQEELARALRAAKPLGMIVRVLPDGSIMFTEPEGADVKPSRPLEARQEFGL